MPKRYIYTATKEGKSLKAKNKAELAKKLNWKQHDINNRLKYKGGEFPFEWGGVTIDREELKKLGEINAKQNPGREFVNSGKLTKTEIAKELGITVSAVTHFGAKNRNLSAGKYRKLKEIINNS